MKESKPLTNFQLSLAVAGGVIFIALICLFFLRFDVAVDIPPPT